MKNLKNCIAVVLLLATLTGCKKEKATEGKPAENHEVTEAAIQVVVDMVVKKDDIVEIFYTEDDPLTFGTKSVRVDVKGKPESQQVVFDFPDNTNLVNLRFDVGQNPEQEEMTINKFVIKQHDKEFAINGADFLTYFNPTDYTKITQGSSFKPVKVKDIYDPFFYGNSTLINALKEFHK